MFCPNCGKQVNDTEKFCWNCGQQLVRTMSEQPTQQQPVQPTQAVQPQPAQAAQAQPTQAVQPQPAQATQAQPTQAVQPQPAQAVQPQPAQAVQTQATQAVPADYSNRVVGVSEAESAYDYRNLPTEKPTGIHSIYLFDFLIRMTEKENIPMLIYLAVNVLIIGGVFTGILMLPIGWGILSGLIVYIASIIMALSPIGEWMLRRQTGCKKIQDAAVINRLDPLFREVYYKAKKANPMISSDVRLFMNDDDAPNAFATGRKTMCVTRGLLTYSDEEIKATLGHEFGHLAHKDTDRILVVSIGNTIITIIFVIMQIMVTIVSLFVDIFSAFSEHGWIISIFNALGRVLSMVILAGLMKLWTLFGVALCMKTSRNNEYQADEFSFNLGYGSALCSLLDSFGDVKAKGLFANLASSHPASSDRIARLKELGAVYEKN